VTLGLQALAGMVQALSGEREIALDIEQHSYR
jgi:hypothetical protein